MIGNALYYLALSVACAAIAIYNFKIGSEGKNTSCYSIETVDNTTYYHMAKLYGNMTAQEIALKELLNLNLVITETNTDTNTSGTITGTGTTSTSMRFLDSIQSNNNSQETFLVGLFKKNTLYALQQTIGAIYTTMLFISLFLTFIIQILANMVPEEFLKISKAKMILALFCKLLPFVLIILHWGIFLVIIILWALWGTKVCEVSIQQGAVYNPYQYYRDTYILNIVTSGLWIVIHYIGGLIREIVYQEPFMYSADVGKPSCFKRFFCKKIGP